MNYLWVFIILIDFELKKEQMTINSQTPNFCFQYYNNINYFFDLNKKLKKNI